jgi:hypothetical protein
MEPRGRIDAPPENLENPILWLTCVDALCSRYSRYFSMVLIENLLALIDSKNDLRRFDL